QQMSGGPFADSAGKTAINRQRAERRRAVARTVHDLRERLTSSTGTRPAFDYELALTYARNRRSATYVLPLLVILVGATSLLWIDVAFVATWALLVLAVQLVTLMMSRHFLATPAA